MRGTMLRQDYIGRLIQQMAEALARAAGLLQKKKLEEAETEIANAESSLGLGSGLDRLDARSVAMMLGGGDKVVLAALVLERRGELAAARGDDPKARRLRLRARSILEQARPHELVTEAAELRARLDLTHFDGI